MIKIANKINKTLKKKQTIFLVVLENRLKYENRKVL